jgi:hypothetical protein
MLLRPITLGPIIEGLLLGGATPGPAPSLTLDSSIVLANPLAAGANPRRRGCISVFEQCSRRYLEDRRIRGAKREVSLDGDEGRAFAWEARRSAPVVEGVHADKGNPADKEAGPGSW